MKLEEETAQTRNSLKDEQGSVIETEYIARQGFDLIQLFNYAYVTGCGFTEVVTNIPAFALRRVDFSITSGYHQTATSQIGFFQPVYFADDEERLYILDVRLDLPAGFTVRKLQPGKYVLLVADEPANEILNAAEVSFNVDSNLDSSDEFPDNVTDHFTTESQQVGSGAGFHQVIIDRHFKRFHDDPNNPDRVTREVEWKTVTRVNAADPSDGSIVQVLEDTQEDKYSNGWLLKIGHTRTVRARVQLPYEAIDPGLQTVRQETEQIIWRRSDFNTDVFVKVWVHKQVKGLILIDGDPDDPEQQVTKTALDVGDADGIVTIDGFQTITEGEISTRSEYWRETGGGQVNIHIVETDHLTGRIRPSSSVDHIADPSTNIRGENRSVERRLVVNEASELKYGPRAAISINIGEVPFEVALPLVKRILERGGNAQRQATVELPCFDANIRRGSLRKLVKRDGAEELFIVLGYKVTGRNLGTRNNPDISMTLEGIIID